MITSKFHGSFVVHQVPPPVLGFNNNVRHRGRVFHIQTEDSGVKTPRIVTHLFADGGHIIKTTRTEYTDILHRSDLAQVVREMMKSQHKAMFAALRRGELDALLEKACGPLPVAARIAEPEVTAAAALPVPAASEVAEPQPKAISGSVIPSLIESVGVPRSRAAAVGTAAPVSTPAGGVSSKPGARPALKGAAPSRGSKSAPPPAGMPKGSVSSQLPAQSSGKPGRSLFGDSMISEKSLDEVILSYLAEDLDGSD